MKISLNWLKEYISLEQSSEEICDILTQTGLEVEGFEQIEQIKGGLKGVVIGEVLTCGKHPNADKLSMTTVDIGLDTPSPIVCGAPNIATGQKVLVATVGTTLYPDQGEGFQIKKAKIRGEVSEGMICAEDELGLGTDHDGILVLDTNLKNGTAASKYFNLENDEVIEIGLTPNRADAISHLGTARDLRAVLKKDILWPDVSKFKTDNTELPIKVSVKNPEACPRYSGLTISGIKIAESPDWLKKKLNSLGLVPINNVVDITNFVLHETGQPLHAFDYDEIEENEVIVDLAGDRLTFTTLDNTERKLNSNDLMISNPNGHMCIAGVFGGVKSGVKDSTTNIFLESAYFSPDYIRKTAQSHSLKTDASFRFERGTDPNNTIFGLKRAALLIKEIAGGNISSEVIDLYPKIIEPFLVPVTYRNINRLIGKELKRNEIKEILIRLDIEVLNETDDGFTAKVPTYRVDVRREADIVEEILRIYGYNNIEIGDSLNSDFLSQFPKVDPGKLALKVSELLIASGYNEIVTNSLTKPEYASETEGISSDEDIIMLNKLSEDLSVLRQDMIFTGLEVLNHNINRKQKNLKLFEFGKTYKKRAGAYEEYSQLALYISGSQEDESWQKQTKSLAFNDLMSAVQAVLSKFNVQKYKSEVVQSGILNYGLEIKVSNKPLVRVGKVLEKIALLAGVKEEVFYAVFDWDLLLKQKRSDLKYSPVSKFPEVRRDLSLVIDKRVTFEQIKAITHQSERSLLRNINVFDVYEGEKIDADKKAYALSFTLQDENKTLTDKTIDKTMNRIIGAFERELGAIIRK